MFQKYPNNIRVTTNKLVVIMTSHLNAKMHNTEHKKTYAVIFNARNWRCATTRENNNARELQLITL